jgi:hypothetical protein
MTTKTNTLTFDIGIIKIMITKTNILTFDIGKRKL